MVERAIQGESGAFGQLYQRHVDGVYNYLCFRVRDVTLAEDLAQDVFVSAFKGISGLKDPGRFEAWLMRIAHNRVLNHWRERKARPEDQEAVEQASVEVAHLGARGLADADSRLDAERVLAAAVALTELQQQIVALRFVAGLSVAESAAVMGRSESAVKNLQHHALAALRRLLAEQVASR